MPERPDDFELTEADIDMIVEDVTGKPVRPANLVAGIASLKQRIKEFEATKANLLHRMETTSEQSLPSVNEPLTTCNRDLSAARAPDDAVSTPARPKELAPSQVFHAVLSTWNIQREADALERQSVTLQPPFFAPFLKQSFG